MNSLLFLVLTRGISLCKRSLRFEKPKVELPVVIWPELNLDWPTLHIPVNQFTWPSVNVSFGLSV
jgi:hypothetical protein